MKALLFFFFASFYLNVWAAPQVMVEGVCQKDVTADRISIVLSARSLEKEASVAAKKVTAKYEEIRQEVKKLNLKDLKLQTINYTVSPEWDYTNNKRSLRGYSANMGLKVETSDVQKAGELLNLSIKTGAQEVSTPMPFLSQSLYQKEYEECLQVAVKSARLKAEKMAQAAGLKVSNLESLSEFKPQSQPGPVYAAKNMMAEAAPSFESQPLSIQVTITATYALK